MEPKHLPRSKYKVSSTTLLNLLIIFICFLLISITLFGQEGKKWDVNNPPYDHKDVSFSVEEGTWMNLDVSPDGKTIAFDLLGDIYTIPMSGGKAKALRTGLAYEIQPRFSPDGKQISFTSDAGGGDNIWVMNTDGSDAKQVTKESFRLLNNAVWTPDGQYLVARKHFSSTRSLGAGEMWMYHISGGAGLQITKRKNDQQDVNEPCVSPDGRYIYFSEDMYGGGYFQYNKDPNNQIFVIKRFDRQEGKTETVIGGSGGAFRPQVSNDGTKIAYVRRVRTRSVLFIHDLKTGQDTPIYDKLSKDQQEAWTIFGIYTGFDWTPDDQNIVVWANGKINKINIASKTATDIPFTADVNQKIADVVRFKQDIAPEQFTAKVIRHSVTSPDGKTLVFSALGYLWKKSLPDGKPQRMTKGTDFESEPSFSTDGSQIVFVTWDDENMGAIHKMSSRGGKSTKLTTEKGIYRTPKFSPNSQQIVYQKERGNDHQGFAFSKKPGIYTMSANGGSSSFVTKSGDNPCFDKTGKRIFYQTGAGYFGGLDKGFHSVKLDGSDKKTIFHSKYINQWAVSPDNEWIAFSELFKVYIAPFPKTGKTIELSSDTKAIPVSQVARDAGINLHWSADSKKLHWMLGEEYFTNALTDRFLFLEGAVDSIPPMDTVGLKVGLVADTDIPEGLVALTNARIITVDANNKVIEKGTVLVENNRIKAIGASDDVAVPRNAKTIDCTGKTIMPGLVDAHAHIGNFRYGISPQKQWHYYANLAYGVTTAHDPSSNTEMVFSQSEMVRSGAMLGPRIFSTGIILYGAEGDFKAKINGLEDALSALRRTKAYGAFSVKSYNQPRREQRQQVIKAAKELEMMVVPEGGSFFYHNMSMILDGHTGVEHNIPIATLHDDVVKLWSNSETGYTPTLIVNYGSVNGEYYWYQHTDVWKKERLLSFTPRGIIDSRARHRTMIPEEEYENGHILTSQSCKKLTDAGVKVNMGAHGQLQGLGAHWELWMLHQGGATELEAIRSATYNGAHYIGMAHEIGSLETGKLADLIVLEKNPLEDILNTETVQYTMINGRLYDAATMNEMGNYDNKRTKFWWETDASSQDFEWFGDTHTHDTKQPTCLCGKH